MRWFYRDRSNFVAFSGLLENLPNSFYSSEFIECLLEENWEEHRNIIFTQLFLPYIFYAFCSILFMKFALDAERQNEEDLQGELSAEQHDEEALQGEISADQQTEDDLQGELSVDQQYEVPLQRELTWGLSCLCIITLLLWLR